MLQLNQALALEEIGEMYGVVGRTTIVRIIELALKHLKQNKTVLKTLQEYDDEEPDIFSQMKHRVATEVVGRGKKNGW
jgi:hypothetical protein